MRASLSLYCSSIEVTTTTKLNMGLQPLTVNWIYSVAIIFDLLAYVRLSICVFPLSRSPQP